MNRTLTYEIKKEYSGYTIEGYLKSLGYSRQNLVELKKMHESIMLNGVWEYINTKLSEGDFLEIRIQETEISEHIPPVKLDFPIVYEDEDIVIVNKPANMPIHPSLNNYENTLANAAAYYYESLNQPFIFRCVNRLDRDTSGLTILAKNMLSANILYSDMRERKIHREYTAIVTGSDIEDSGTIDMPIGRLEGSTIERVIDYEKGERAVTHYRVVTRDIKRNLALIKCNLETGRTHQIRVHMKAIGHPLVGDFLYNPDDTNMNRQALHAGKLEFTHPITKEELSFCAEIPEDFCIRQWDTVKDERTVPKTGDTAYI